MPAGRTFIKPATFPGQTYLPAGRLRGSLMTRQEAAEILERVAIGSDDKVASVTVTRILTDPDYAHEVWLEARKFLVAEAGDYLLQRERHRACWDQVEQAAQTLNLGTALGPVG